MKRGEVWTVSGGQDYTGKPRPVAIVQNDRFEETDSVTVCPFTTNPVEAPLMRVQVEPDDGNGLRLPCRLMIDKISTVSRAKLRTRVGRLDAETILRMNRAIFVFLGFADPAAPQRRRSAER
jgi:mRNA interferase MazF